MCIVITLYTFSDVSRHFSISFPLKRLHNSHLRQSTDYKTSPILSCGTAFKSSSPQIPASKMRYPAQEIIAALSVQSSMGGQ